MVAILGAGNGGLALAAHLVKSGREVRLWNRSSARFDRSLKNQKLQVRDHIQGREWEVELSNCTLNLEDAVKGASLIIIVTPGTAHEELAQNLGPLLREGQSVLLMPGRTFGSLSFYDQFKRYALTNMSCFEAQTILHACRSFEGGVDIFAMKGEVLFSAPFPAHEAHKKFIVDLMPNLRWNDNFNTVTLNNIGAMLHPLPTLFNSARIESGEFFYFYTQGVSPSIARLIERLDLERSLVCKALGAEFQSVKEWLKIEYGSEGNNLYEALMNTTAYKSIPAPTTLQHRYLIDDTLTGLVPIYNVGRAHQIEMPFTKAIIDLIGALLNRNLLEEGRKYRLS